MAYTLNTQVVAIRPEPLGTVEADFVPPVAGLAAGLCRRPLFTASAEVPFWLTPSRSVGGDGQVGGLDDSYGVEDPYAPTASGEAEGEESIPSLLEVRSTDCPPLSLHVPLPSGGVYLFSFGEWHTFADEERRVVGRGGSSRVFRVAHTPSGFGVGIAMKERLFAAAQPRAEARHELVAFTAIRDASPLCEGSPHAPTVDGVVPLLGTFYSGGALLSFYPLMGGSLADALRGISSSSCVVCCGGVEGTRGGLEEAAACIARRLLGALAALHSIGVAHGDVTPSNVLLRPSTGTPCEELAVLGQQESECVVCGLLAVAGTSSLSDFGLAQLRKDCEDATATSAMGMASRSVAYCPPYVLAESEAVCGGAEAAGDRWQRLVASDVWGLGIVVAEVLLGHHPFIGSEGEGPAGARKTNEGLSPLWQAQRLLSEDHAAEGRMGCVGGGGLLVDAFIADPLRFAARSFGYPFANANGHAGCLPFSGRLRSFTPACGDFLSACLAAGAAPWREPSDAVNKNSPARRLLDHPWLDAALHGRVTA